MKAPFSWPKSSLSSRFSLSAAQWTRTKGLVATGTRVVDRAGDELLAGAALAADQHRHGGRGHQRDPRVDTSHRRGGPDDVLGPELFPEGGTQTQVLLREARLMGGGLPCDLDVMGDESGDDAQDPFGVVEAERARPIAIGREGADHLTIETDGNAEEGDTR